MRLVMPWVYRSLIALIATPGVVSGQLSVGATRVIGRIHDENRTPITNAEILVNGTVRSISDSVGLFALRVGRGDSTVMFRRIGFRPLALSLKSLPHAGDTVQVLMEQTSAELDAISIRSTPLKPLRYAGTSRFDGVFHRRRIGLGTLITREEIEMLQVSRTADLLRGVPGVRATSDRIRFARCPEPGGVAVFIDGQRQHAKAETIDVVIKEFPEMEILSRIDPSDVEMIEVFRGASQIPAEMHWNGCAVIAVWTRWFPQ